MTGGASATDRLPEELAVARARSVVAVIERPGTTQKEAGETTTGHALAPSSSPALALCTRSCSSTALYAMSVASLRSPLVPAVVMLLLSVQVLVRPSISCHALASIRLTNLYISVDRPPTSPRSVLCESRRVNRDRLPFNRTDAKTPSFVSAPATFPISTLRLSLQQFSGCCPSCRGSVRVPCPLA